MINKKKARVTQLDFTKDPIFDTCGVIDEDHRKPYIIEVKKHFLARWKYVMDNDTNCPRLFFGSQSVILYLIDNKIKLKYDSSRTSN